MPQPLEEPEPVPVPLPEPDPDPVPVPEVGSESVDLPQQTIKTIIAR